MRIYTYFQKGEKTKKVKKGFSWTLFFFGFWVPLFKADWSFLLFLFLLQFLMFLSSIVWLVGGLAFLYFPEWVVSIVNVLANILSFFAGKKGFIFSLVINLVFASFYNKHLCTRYLKKGYAVVEGPPQEPSAATPAPNGESVANASEPLSPVETKESSSLAQSGEIEDTPPAVKESTKQSEEAKQTVPDVSVKKDGDVPSPCPSSIKLHVFGAEYRKEGDVEKQKAISMGIPAQGMVYVPPEKRCE